MVKTATVYGIKNCDTMKKAFKWLDDHEISYEFHDYKKLGSDEAVLLDAIETHGWENVLNRKGTTWRKISDDVKNNMDKKRAIALAKENPSVIKRPILKTDTGYYLGFSVEEYAEIFK